MSSSLQRLTIDTCPACRLARLPKSRIYLTSVQIYGNLKVGVVYITRNIKIKVARAELDMTQKALAEFLLLGQFLYCTSKSPWN